MVKLNHRILRIALATGFVWLAVAVAAWLAIEPSIGLVGAKPRSLQAADLLALQRTDLTQEQAILEKTMVWPMQRDGLPPVVKVPVVTVEKKILWTVVATVVRTKQGYLLIQDQDTKLISQVNVGDVLPDGSKLLQVGVAAYVVRSSDGKKRTVETNI